MIERFVFSTYRLRGKLITMVSQLRRYATTAVLSTLLSLFLIGCGGGGASPSPNPGPDPGSSGFTITGKITSSSGPTSGTTVELFNTEYSIYTIDGLYSTRNPNSIPPGAESVKPVGPAVQAVSTNALGAYNFTGVPSGRYTIVATSSTYVFKWSLIPTRRDIGVVTITADGTVYIYNPEGNDNKLFGQTIIYNTVEPFPITNKTLGGLDFEASLPGSSGI
jgi:hypothetical protein